MNKAIIWLCIFISTIAIFFILVTLTSTEVISARESSITYIRQMHASFTLANGNPFRQFGFWHWNINSRELFTESPIHLSYPIISYLPNTLIAYLTRSESQYNVFTFVLAISQLFGLSWIIYDLFEYHSNNGHKYAVKFFSIIAALLFITSPASLGLLIEPDFEDSFILFSLLGVWLCLKNKPRYLSNFSFLIASCSYATGASVIILGSILVNIITSIFHRDFSYAKIPLLKDKFKQVLTFPFFNRISLLPFICGVSIYIVFRLLALSSLHSTGIESTGAMPIFRIGLDPLDTYYGGIISTFKYLIPVSKIPADLLVFDTDKLNIELIWSIVNAFLLLFEIGAIYILATVYSFRKFTKLDISDSNNNSLVVTYFAFLCIFYTALFPQWSAVHFRLLARLFAPALSVAIAALLMGLNSIICKSRNVWLSWEVSLISWLLMIDQLRFFLTWNV